MEIMKRTHSGVAVCDVAVQEWDEAPLPVVASENELLLAEVHRGTCRRCALDVERWRKTRPGGFGEERVVPLRGLKNHMDPLFRFPYDKYWHLFSQATDVEAMLLALDHMMVHTIMIRRGGFTKFRKIPLPSSRSCQRLRSGWA